MIWTVIMKDGKNFVVHGATFDREGEIRKSLRGRGWEVDNVAGVVQGNHNVEVLNEINPRPTFESIHKARQAAMQAPTILEAKSESTFEHVIGGGDCITEVVNDPVDWQEREEFIKFKQVQAAY